MRVLIAENNLSNRLVARSILEREFHDVVIVTNGAEAVYKIQSKQFDVLLLDTVMPVMDGFQTVQYLRQLPDRPTFIFALSAYDSHSDVTLYRAAGFDGLIAKPLRPGDLSAAMAGGHRRAEPSLTGVAANAPDADMRPLLDTTIIRDGPGQADDVTRERILRSYRANLSASLKDLSRSLPGYIDQDKAAARVFLDALHSLRSTSLSVGMNRAPYLATCLRDADRGDVIDAVARLLHAVRDSLPLLETALLGLPRSSITPG